jgi:small nuclear ribonucleoprotein (snRNP)-like protein
MKSFYQKLFNIKKWLFNTIIIVGLLLIIAIMMNIPRAKSSTIEGLKIKTNDISMNIVLTDTTKILTDPNPNGIFNVYTYTNSESVMEDLMIKYPIKNGSLDAELPFDASYSVTVLKIEPKDMTGDPSYTTLCIENAQSNVTNSLKTTNEIGGLNEKRCNIDKHRTDMFPISCKLDITMDNDSPLYELSQESSDKSIQNTTTPSADLSGNEITIVKNGDIIDDKSNKIGTVYKGDKNPLDPSSKNPYILNITLKDSTNISRINIEYVIPKPVKTTNM